MLQARNLLGVLFAAGAIALAGAQSLVAAPEAEREISFFHIHTKETLTIVYKRDGKYVPEAMDKIDWLMRDWRQNKAIKMDPKTIDILWEIHEELGSKEPIHIICGYRSGSTNEMLRRTVGGQAKNSNHISGIAIDAYFPDVPPKYARYAGLVRERGGVGYYPTSALPFVHIDTGRVRHWPKISHDELALLFPNDKSRHVPLGGALRSGDHQRALARNKALVGEVVAYNDVRNRVKPAASILVATNTPTPPAPVPAARPAIAKPAPPKPILAALTSPTPPAAKPAPLTASPIVRPDVTEPKLVAAPRLIERPSRFTPRPSDAERAQLNQLVTMASLDAVGPPPKLLAAPAPAKRPQKQSAVEPAAVTPEGSFDPDDKVSATSAGDWSVTWVTAPEYDDDHPDELSYRPFPLTPMLTVSASPDDPALAQLIHPDLARTLEVLDDDGAIQPMRLRPRQQVAELLWAQQFHGSAVMLAEETIAAANEQVPPGLANRSVKTTSR